MSVDIKVETTLRGINGVTKRLSEGELFLRASRALHQVLDELKDQVVANTPRASGNTAENIFTDVYGTSIHDLNGIVASPDEHFAVLEFGRKPGSRMPPSDPIWEWMADTNIDSDDPRYTPRDINWMIRRAIARRGLPALHIMQRAVEQRRQSFPIVFMRVFLENWFTGSDEV